ncbi:MAG: ABC transporter ATP-binding protein [Ancalomicrobiaceae bacterium]|nr:ABC transporter ATP-binding protein [Ancalomicrobiaceae bacterium]
MIRFDQVSKSYGRNRQVIDDLTLAIAEGEICMLVGPSGCGKTTSMKMINRLVEPDSGTVLVDGRPVNSVDPIKLRLNIGYVIQEIGLFPHMSVADNIATVPVELGWPKPRVRARVDDLLALVDLEPGLYRTKRPRELSGGQRQRVGIARALAGDPRIMLMDEPFGALDPLTRAKMQDEFLAIQEKIRKTIVFVTHDTDEALKMGDHIAVMRAGRLLQYGTPTEILRHPADTFVADLIGSRKGLKLLRLLDCGSLMRQGAAAADLPVLPARATAEQALSEMLRCGCRSVAVADASGVTLGRLDLDDLIDRVARDD